MVTQIRKRVGKPAFPTLEALRFSVVVPSNAFQVSDGT